MYNFKPLRNFFLTIWAKQTKVFEKLWESLGKFYINVLEVLSNLIE